MIKLFKQKFCNKRIWFHMQVKESKRNSGVEIKAGLPDWGQF